MHFYELAYCWYEDYMPHIFAYDKEISEDEWGIICDGLLEQSVQKALAKEDFWIGWQQITEAMCDELQRLGFKLITPKKYSYFGTNILRLNGVGASNDATAIKKLSPTSLRLIEEHNQKVEDNKLERKRNRK